MSIPITKQEDKQDISAIEGEEKIDPSHLEQADADKGPIGAQADAIRAEQNEHDIPLLQALKVYKSAILWSMAISLVIVMDGYDTGCKYTTLSGGLQ